MMAEQHPPVGRHIVHAVVVAFGRGLARVVESQYALGNEPAIEAVSDEINDEGRSHEPHGIDTFTASEREPGEGDSAGSGQHAPQENGRKLVHDASALENNVRRSNPAQGQYRKFRSVPPSAAQQQADFRALRVPPKNRLHPPLRRRKARFPFVCSLVSPTPGTWQRKRGRRSAANAGVGDGFRMLPVP